MPEPLRILSISAHPAGRLAACEAGVEETFHLDGLLQAVWPDHPPGWMELWGHPDCPLPPESAAIPPQNLVWLRAFRGHQVDPVAAQINLQHLWFYNIPSNLAAHRRRDSNPTQKGELNAAFPWFVRFLPDPHENKLPENSPPHRQRKINRQENTNEEVTMNPATPKTEPQPSTDSQNAVFGGSYMSKPSQILAAVAELLHRLGVRWYMPSAFGEIVPHQPTITVADVEVRESPDFPMRDYHSHLNAEMIPQEYLWKLTDRRKFYQDLADRTSGKSGKLVKLAPRQAAFALDPGDQGRILRWYLSAHDRKSWPPVDPTRPYYLQVKGAFDESSMPYAGAMWYAFEMDMPRVANGQPLHFCVSTISPQAWVWVNGEYVGRRLYQEPWVRPASLDLDISQAVKPGGKNLIVVRVSTGANRTQAPEGFLGRAFLYLPNAGTKPLQAEGAAY